MYELRQEAGPRVRDLLRRCGMTRDRAERAALLARAASELDQAAEKVATSSLIDIITLLWSSWV